MGTFREGYGRGMTADRREASGRAEREVYLAFGANLGDRVAAIRVGVEALRGAGVEPQAFSALYRSRPKYVADQPSFVNGVGCFRTRLEPRELLEACRAAERAAGRKPRGRYGPRELDVDILLYSDLRLEEEGLHIPHPGIPERLFVLVPLAELAPGLEIPALGNVTVLRDAALRALPEEEAVTEIGVLFPERDRPVEGPPEP